MQTEAGRMGRRTNSKEKILSQTCHKKTQPAVWEVRLDKKETGSDLLPAKKEIIYKRHCKIERNCSYFWAVTLEEMVRWKS